MIQFTTPDRIAIVCDSCSKPIDRPAPAVVVRWAGRAALVVHDGACLDLLRLQYPSTTREPVLPLAVALEQLAWEGRHD